jgi:dipeptidyl aminopeptidase/acylaminoacyl peptidase
MFFPASLKLVRERLAPSPRILSTTHPARFLTIALLLLASLAFMNATALGAGPKIVFGSSRNGDNHDIYSMDLDGHNQTRLTTNAAYDDQPKWSPDRSKIAFISDRDGNFEIYTMMPDGNAQTRITNNFAADGFPTWSPDGTKLAFVRGDLRNPSTFEIYVMDANGSNQTRLTVDSAIDGVPAWSRDGSKIVFMSGGSSIFDPNSFEIYVMNADGGNRTRLTNNNVADGQPSYSPDGSKILFASGDALSPNGIEIYVMNADGSNRTRLTSNTVTDGFPAWSFDGSNIVFASGNVSDETSVELWVMNANGTNPARLTNNTQLDWFPDWEPVQTPPSQIQLIGTTFFAGEGSGGALITILRSGNTSGMASVNIATSDTAGASNCSDISTSTASSRCDYVTRVGTLIFAPGDPAKTTTVFILDDSYHENDETFTITLSNVSGSGAVLGSQTTGTIHITDNDSVNGPNPIDQTDFLVRQHYLDFLNRDPDNTGRLFWTNEIDNCTPKPQCTEVKRINVSAAFFLSIEFQQTGYLVYRMYKVAYGIPVGATVPLKLDEFLPDTQQIGAGVIVGNSGWEQKLENNKQAFALDFVSRARFISVYPTTLTPAQFVDPLFMKAGVNPTTAERNAALNEFGTATNTADTAARSRALRRVAENLTLIQQENNKAFVLMQYFGYLQRNPNDAPEPGQNFDGYNFWLGKLNQFNGNFIQAEMVKAFLASDEYRQRFGPAH